MTSHGSTKKAVITGASGYIGSQLAKRLVHLGWEVACVLRPTSNLELLEPIEGQYKKIFYHNDVEALGNNLKALTPSIVFHLASCFVNEHEPQHVAPLIYSNVLFGTHLLEAMSLAGISKIINTGSVMQHQQNLTYEPSCLYAATKEAFEKIIAFYVDCRQYQCITLKLTSTYGPNDPRHKLVNVLQRASQNQQELQLPPPQQTVDLVYIDDVINAYKIAADCLLQMNEDAFYRTYLVTTGRLLQMGEVVSKFEQLTGRTLNVSWGARPLSNQSLSYLIENYPRLPDWEARYVFPDQLSILSRNEQSVLQ